MTDSARYALHRPELGPSLAAGEQKIRALLEGSAENYREDRILIEAGTDHPYVYRMIKGWAGRTRTLPDGRIQCILMFLPGDLFAVKSMFVMKHPDEVRVLADSLIERIDCHRLYQAFGRDGDVAARCAWQIVEEERRLHNWVVSLGQGVAEERLAMLLVDFHGRLVMSGVIAPDALTYEMPLTQTQIADYLGITPIHVNRVLRVFRESQVALVRNREVQILNVEKLAQIADPLLDPYEKQNPAYVGGRAGRRDN